MVHHRTVDMSKIDDEHITIEECFALLQQGADRGSPTPHPPGGPNRGVGRTRRTKKRDRPCGICSTRVRARRGRATETNSTRLRLTIPFGRCLWRGCEASHGQPITQLWATVQA